jgi:hypothetical protein
LRIATVLTFATYVPSGSSAAVSAGEACLSILVSQLTATIITIRRRIGRAVTGRVSSLAGFSSTTSLTAIVFRLLLIRCLNETNLGREFSLLHFLPLFRALSTRIDSDGPVVLQ